MRPAASAVIAAVLAVSGADIAQADPAMITGPARVVDGDTIDVGVVRIRLHGIDAPEAGQTCVRPDGGEWECGTASSNRLAELVEGRIVECEAIDRDVYGRIIGRCFHTGVDKNALLVDEGLAWAFRRYSEDYVEFEERAQKARIGIWQGEAEEPWDYRANRWERAAEASPRPGCPIKGNINRDGEKIYHTPWSPWYERTQIDENQGQRWFCDEGEAQAAGWRAARGR